MLTISVLSNQKKRQDDALIIIDFFQHSIFAFICFFLYFQFYMRVE